MVDQIACKILLGLVGLAFFSGALFIIFYWETQEDLRSDIFWGGVLYFVIFGGLFAYMAYGIMK